MPTQTQTSKVRSPFITLALLLSLFYLSYLGLTTQATVFNDGWAYEKIGRVLAEEPWQNYFISGPNRELIYPLLVSVAMRISNILGVPYLNIEIPLQILCLILTQLLMIKILKKMQVSDGIISTVVLFIGFSPAMVNSSLILYSEIITYPLILWCILNISNSWKNIEHTSILHAILMGLATGCSFALMTLAKASFEIITALTFLPFLTLLIQALTKKNKRSCVHILIFLLAFAAVYQAPILTIKFLNKKFNGNFVLTDRGAGILYTSTEYLTTAPLNKDYLLAAASYIPGPEFCNKLGLKECYHWSVEYYDISFESAMKKAAGQGLTNQETSFSYIHCIIQKIIQNPIQYIIFSGMNALKLLFWEGTQTAYVTYPDAVERFYNAEWLQYIVRFTMAILNMLALMASFYVILKKGTVLFNPRGSDNNHPLLFWTTLIIMTYILLLSRFYLTAPRYGLPIAPLWLILSAWLIDHLIKNRKARAL